MKKLIVIVFAAALMTIVFGACAFLMGGDGENGGGNLIIRMGDAGDERAILAGAELPPEVLKSLRYELTLTGPGGEPVAASVVGEESLRMTAALGAWRIEAAAYEGDVLAGTGNLDFTVAPGLNTIRIPMRINGGYFAVTVSGISGGTVAASPAAAFPGTTITLTVTPDEGYALKAGSLKYRHGDSDYTPEGSESAYTFTMPAADVAVSAVFNPVLGVGSITIEGPRDETILVTAAHSAGGSSTTISRSANESVTFTLDSPGYTAEARNLLWFVEGEPQYGTGNSFTISAVAYAERTYNLTVMIQVNGQWYSADTVFTVVQ